MTYLSAKKIYPGNWAEPLNGWYRNIDSNDDGTNNASNGGPTSVLATPGYRYFQQRGYVAVTNTSGDGPVKEASVIVPSPYRNDDTRTDITGMVVSGSPTLPAYGYRATISVASGWGDGRVASGVYAHSGHVISFGRLNGSNPTSAAADAEGVIQANLSGVDGTDDSNDEQYIVGGTAAYSTVPLITATGAAGVGAGNVYHQLTAATTFKVFSKTATTATVTGATGGWYISSGDAAAGRVGYLVTEICYIQPDEAPGYEDIEGYLTGRTVS
jgi:hypothetical protein